MHVNRHQPFTDEERCIRFRCPVCEVTTRISFNSVGLLKKHMKRSHPSYFEVIRPTPEPVPVVDPSNKLRKLQDQQSNSVGGEGSSESNFEEIFRHEGSESNLDITNEESFANTNTSSMSSKGKWNSLEVPIGILRYALYEIRLRIKYFKNLVLRSI